MKKITCLLFILGSLYTSAQDVDLFNYDWELTHLEINGTDIFPPDNTEALPVGREFATDNTLLTYVCNAGYGMVTFDNLTNSFTIPESGFAVTLMMCVVPENDAFESSYFGFYFTNIPNPFSYSIVDLSGSKLLTITGADGNKAYYQGMPLGVGSFNSNQWTVYPNPVDNQLHFRFSEISGQAFTVRIYDLLGKLCIDKKVDAASAQVDVQQLNPGIYLVNYSDDGISNTVKFVKK